METTLLALTGPQNVPTNLSVRAAKKKVGVRAHMSSDILNAPCNSADNFVFKHTKFFTRFNSYLPFLHYTFSAKSDGHLYISIHKIILISYQCLSLGGLFKNTPPPSIADILNRLETVHLQENEIRPRSF